MAGEGEWISNSYATGNVSGGSTAGGLVGMGYNIDSSYATGAVTGTNEVGGLAGNVTNLSNSYATGAVTGTDCVGGLAGCGRHIENSYATGKVNGKTRVGGLAGINTGINTSSYYNSETSGQSDTGKGEGKNTAQMKKKATYQNWNFNSIWSIAEGKDYPRLILVDAPVQEVKPVDPPPPKPPVQTKPVDPKPSVTTKPPLDSKPAANLKPPVNNKPNPISPEGYSTDKEIQRLKAEYMERKNREVPKVNNKNLEKYGIIVNENQFENKINSPEPGVYNVDKEINFDDIIKSSLKEVKNTKSDFDNFFDAATGSINPVMLYTRMGLDNVNAQLKKVLNIVFEKQANTITKDFEALNSISDGAYTNIGQDPDSLIKNTDALVKDLQANQTSYIQLGAGEKATQLIDRSFLALDAVDAANLLKDLGQGFFNRPHLVEKILSMPKQERKNFYPNLKKFTDLSTDLLSTKTGKTTASKLKKIALDTFGSTEVADAISEVVMNAVQPDTIKHGVDVSKNIKITFDSLKTMAVILESNRRADELSGFMRSARAEEKLKFIAQTHILKNIDSDRSRERLRHQKYYGIDYENGWFSDSYSLKVQNP